MNTIKNKLVTPPLNGTIDVQPMVSYAHMDDASVRFCQYAKDKIPQWAVDVQPYTPEPPSPIPCPHCNGTGYISPY